MKFHTLNKDEILMINRKCFLTVLTVQRYTFHIPSISVGLRRKNRPTLI